MEITKELLQGYRSKKDEILELDYILKNRWRDEGLIGNDVIFDYSKGYPSSSPAVAEIILKVDPGAVFSCVARL